MFSLGPSSSSYHRILKSLSTAWAARAISVAVAIAVLTAFCLCSSKVSSALDCSGTLPMGGSQTTDLVVNGTCNVLGLSGSVAVYVFHNVNIVNGGELTFDDARIDFHAESIIVENGGKFTAGSISRPIGTNPIMGETGARLRIYLWGPMNDPDGGALCNQSNCGVPDGSNGTSNLWTSNTTLANHTVPHPKNADCTKASKVNQAYKLPGDDCFYQYDPFDDVDSQKNRAAYFGHKVLALSYGGTIQMFGVKGATYDADKDKDPSYTGQSWVRLAGISADKTVLTLSAAVNWATGDHIIVTTTDYLPSHNEEVVIQQVKDATHVVVPALTWLHNATTYDLSSVPATIGPRHDPSVTCSAGQTRCVETRAAVGLLTRSIEILSEGDTPDTATHPEGYDYFPPTVGNYFGGHTVNRQGFKQYQVKGVEFYHLGQGGIIGHYPVHFHMARKTTDPNQDPTTVPYLRDSSIHDSMTRWIVVHATQGMTLARNVGYLSIGHGFYLEDATEVNNKLYANLGAGVIAAVQISDQKAWPLNPRMVPGILARQGDPPPGDLMPYRSDWNHPSAFWIMNGWNDFQYNMAAGVTSCGACYWLLPGADGGPSMFEVWDGYASQKLDNAGADLNNIARAGLSPLKNFVGNSCVAAMNSFQTVGDTNDCRGFTDGSSNDVTLQAVPNPLALPLKGNESNPKYMLYYPQITGLANPSLCPGEDGVDCSSGKQPTDPCASTGVNRAHCMLTVLDHYTTSFNYAQTNFAAVWLRGKWFLFTDGAVTDAQYGGLNFTTGGGYTRSDFPLGGWMLAYRSAFIGSSQAKSGMPANAYASNAGPFNPDTIMCDNPADYGYCLSTKDGISMQVLPFPGQRMFSVYDGPSFQDSNAYLDVYPTSMPDPASGWMYRQRSQAGVTKKDKSNPAQCYLPNAAIAWKQPNGFYYPPAFHSQNLMFQNTNIRHFLIEPLFQTLSQPQAGPFMGDTNKINDRYCPGNNSPAMFNGFTDIDRQTVLNDGVPDVKTPLKAGGDGSLTGYIATENTPTKTTGRETISVNEDAFFNAPVEDVECASDKHANANDGKGAPGTAKTSPYEYLTTAMIAGCAIGDTGGVNNECVQDNVAYWTHQGATPETFGVPLYREYLTEKEFTKNPKTKPFIQMMGQGSGQRSTLTLSHGRYYIDTSNNCTAQGGCRAPDPPPPPPPAPPPPSNPKGTSVFLGGNTYYVYFVYGRASTQLTFDIYLGPNDETGKWAVAPVRGVFNDNNYKFTTVKSAAPWLEEPKYDNKTNLLTVTVDLSQSNIASEFRAELKNSCAPATFCEVKRKGVQMTCGCKAGTNCKDDEVCTWGPKDPDCPDENRADPEKGGCYGFSFTMPGDWSAGNHVDPPNAMKFSDNSYFDKTNVDLKAVPITKSGSQCFYGTQR